MTASTLVKPKALPLIRDRFVLPETQTSWQISESQEDSKVDGTNILARVVGPFFLVNGESLNKRYYTKELWEKCLANCANRFAAGGLFGTVGHDQPLDESALRAGNLSHTVTKLWITPEGVGMGELYVLGTDAGKQLNVCLRAGMPLPVSSRAYGQIKGSGPNGSDLIDEDSFYLETFDFVLNPGVESAYPKVVETLNEQEDKDQMSKELLEQLMGEKSQLQAQLNEVLTANRAFEAQAKELDKAKQVISFYRKNVGKMAEVKELAEGLRRFLQLEPFKKLAQDKDYLDRPEGQLKQIAEALHSFVEETIKTGSPTEVKAIRDSLAEFEAIGSVEQMNSLIGIFETYAAMGSPKDLARKLETANKVGEALVSAKKKAAANKIATKLNVNEKVVTDLLKRMPVKEVIESLKALKESADTTKRYRAEEKPATKENKKVVPIGRRAGGFSPTSMFEDWSRTADRLTAQSIAENAIKLGGH
jgi:hypothetical protein